MTNTGSVRDSHPISDCVFTLWPLQVAKEKRTPRDGRRIIDSARGASGVSARRRSLTTRFFDDASIQTRGTPAPRDARSALARLRISTLQKGGENFVGQNKAKLAVGPGRVPKCPGPEMSYALANC